MLYSKIIESSLHMGRNWLMRAREIMKPSFSNALRIFYKHLPKPFMVIEISLLKNIQWSANLAQNFLSLKLLVAALKQF